MPRVDVLRDVPVIRSTRVAQVEGMFDLQAETVSRFHVAVDLPVDDKEWHVGLLVGPSGSGKTTLLREAFGDPVRVDWPSDKAIVDAFGEHPVKDVVAVLSSVGFSSPPAWLRPYRTLSNGEAFRADMARMLFESRDLAVVDEFTSVVDRTVAQVASAAIAKYVRRSRKRLVAASCHYDIIDWLQPDWMYDLGNGVFEWRCLQQRPPVDLRIERCGIDAWGIFRRHHYLSSSLLPHAVCVMGTVGDRPAAFASAVPFPHPSVRNVWREHRTVCLPDFQGIGIGNAVSELLAGAFKASGRRYRSVTSHPAMIAHRARSPLWHMDRRPSLPGVESRSSTYGRSLRTRWSASFEYVGPVNLEARERLLSDLPQAHLASRGKRANRSGAF